MKTVLALLLAAAAVLASSARADVFIYRGVDTFTIDAQSGAPFAGNTIGTYVVVDYDGQQVGSIIFGRIEGAKLFQVTSAATYNFTNATERNGKTASIIVTGQSTDDNPTSFDYNLTFYRGTNTNLVIRKTPSVTTALRPSTLKGAAINASSTQTFTDLRNVLMLQAAATIKANNANQSITDALAALATELTAKGFTPVTP